RVPGVRSVRRLHAVGNAGNERQFDDRSSTALTRPLRRAGRGLTGAAPTAPAPSTAAIAAPFGTASDHEISMRTATGASYSTGATLLTNTPISATNDTSTSAPVVSTIAIVRSERSSSSVVRQREATNATAVVRKLAPHGTCSLTSIAKRCSQRVSGFAISSARW